MPELPNVIKAIKEEQPDNDLDKTREENNVLATQVDEDFKTNKSKNKLNPTKIAEKDWQDPYKLSRLIEQQKFNNFDGAYEFGGLS